MGFILVDNGGGDFELIPECTYIATCVLLADIGTHTESFQGGEPKDVEKIFIGWELNACDSKGKPYQIGNTYNAYFTMNSTLRKVLQQWRGRAFTEEELKGFDIRNILGKSCGLGVIHNPTKDASKKYAKVGSIQALPAGVPPYEPATTPWTFSIHEYNQADFDRLPYWAKKNCKESYEYIQMVSDGRIIESAPLEDTESFSSADLLTEDDIPF